MASTEWRSLQGAFRSIGSIFDKGSKDGAGPRTVAAPDPVDGRLNGIQGDKILGWAFDERNPDAHVEVEILIDGSVCGTTFANLFREDLLANGKGAGDHAYALSIDARFFDGQAHSIEARAKGRSKIFKGRIANRMLSAVDATRQQQAVEAAGPISGRLEGFKAGEIFGWAFDRTDPAAHVDVMVELDGTPIAKVTASEPRADLARAGLGSGDHGFRWSIPSDLYDKTFDSIAVKAVGYDAYLRGVMDKASIADPRRLLAVADAKATSAPDRNLREPEPSSASGTQAALSKWSALLRLRQPRVTIIVPVYNALEEVKRCIQALIANTTYPCTLLIINDCSPDPAIRPMLDACVGLPNVVVRHNETNLGFTRTVATGISMAGADDVVLLNSDTRVTPRWLENLVLAAHEDERIGTATPLSDNAGPFSVPRADGNVIPDWLTDDQMARVVSHNSGIEWPRSPTANGFCTYVRRDYIDDVGSLDADAFPRGYGEENEFSMRGVRRGWRHKVDDRTFVFHERSASFGDAKTALLAAGRAVVDERFPEYTGLVRTFVACDGLKRIRERVQDGLASVFVHRKPPKKRVLFVINKNTGGTPQTNRDLMSGVEDRYECFVLRSDGQTIAIDRFANGVSETVRQHVLDRPIDLKTHRSEEYERVVSGWLIALAIEMIHVRHVGLHSLDLFTVANLLTIPVIVSFHDFYAVCPNTKLVDDKGVHCAGVCTESQGDCSIDLWRPKDVPPLKHRWVYGWRSIVGEALGRGDAFVTTSERAAELIRQAYPQLAHEDFRIIPHGRDFPAFREPTAHPMDDKVRIVVPGNISAAKGGRIMQRLKELDVEGRLEFHVFGNVSREFDSSKIILHGPYDREDAVERFRSIDPHFGMILSIWPETYCHTLTEMWAAGIPVAGFDIGAVGERLHLHGGGWPLPIADAETVYAALVALANEASVGEQNALVRAWQLGHGADYGIGAMAERYACLYEDVASRRRRIGGADTAGQLEAVWNSL